MGILTVVITTYNRQDLLSRAIDSVKNAGVDAEIIVVDDASTDRTEQLCRGISGIKYLRLEKNSGTAASRNAGIMASSRPFISFLDDDDFRLPGSFEPQLALLEQNESCALVYGKVLYSNQENELTGHSNLHEPSPRGDVMVNLFRRNFITLSSVVVRKQSLVEKGMFDTSRKMLGLEDWDMWLRLSESYSFLAVDHPVAVYRKPEVNSGQWYSNPGRQYSMACEAYKSKWFHLPGIKERTGAQFSGLKETILSEISDIIAFGVLNHSRSISDKSSRLIALVKCRPKNLLSLRFYKTFIKALINAR